MHQIRRSLQANFTQRYLSFQSFYFASKVSKTSHKQTNPPQKKVQSNANISENIPKPILSSKYGRQINDLLQKKQMNCQDLQFLGIMLKNTNTQLSNNEVSRIKEEIKNIKDIQFTSLARLIELTNVLGINHTPISFRQCIINHFRQNKFSEEKVRQFPSSFLKQISYALFVSCFSENIEKSAQILKVLGSLMSTQQLKKVDSLCCDALQTLNSNQVIRFMNIFRQLKRKGNFVEMASEVILDKKDEISPKYMLMLLISILELGNHQNFALFEPFLLNNIKTTQKFQPTQLLALLQIFHKYKVGSPQFWQLISQKMIQEKIKLSFENMFALLSGYTRTYQPNPELLLEFINLEPTLSYVTNLNEKQFIQFFLVVYFHSSTMDKERYQKNIKTIMNAIQNRQLKSVYRQIQNLFLFLFAQENDKNTYLRKTYPDDILLSLLSIEFNLSQNVDKQQKQNYEEDLMSRYNKQIWQNNKKIIIVQEFIRYKIISAKKREFKDNLL